MRIEDLKAGMIVEYKRNGQVGAYEARVEGFTGGRVILKVFRYLWGGSCASEELAPVVRVKPKRILRLRDVQKIGGAK